MSKYNLAEIRAKHLAKFRYVPTPDSPPQPAKTAPPRAEPQYRSRPRPVKRKKKAAKRPSEKSLAIRRQQWLKSTGLLPPEERGTPLNAEPLTWTCQQRLWYEDAMDRAMAYLDGFGRPVKRCWCCGEPLNLPFACYRPKLCDSCAAYYNYLVRQIGVRFPSAIDAPVVDFDPNGSWNASSFDNVVAAYEEDR